MRKCFPRKLLFLLRNYCVLEFVSGYFELAVLMYTNNAIQVVGIAIRTGVIQGEDWYCPKINLSGS